MKKLLLALAIASVSVTGFAQNDAVAQQYGVATNSFWSNWFVQVGGEWTAWYSGQEHGLNLSQSPFKSFRSTPAAAVAVGKWFTPGLGLRVKAQGIWGKRVYDPRFNNDAKGNFTGDAENSTKYWDLNGQALFNLSNIFYGYNPNRFWNFIPFAGAGFGRSMSEDFYGMNLSVGILNTFRISKKVAAHLELGWTRLEGVVDGYDQLYGDRGWVSHDNLLYAELGLTFNLGKAGWEKTPDVDAINAEHQAALDALNAKLRDADNENGRLKSMLANQPKEVVSKSVKELIATPISVFFNLDKIDIASLKDLVNVRALAKYAKENNKKLLVTGYADSATGSPEHNKVLSENRAKAVAAELVKMGIDPANIKTTSHGGVETLSPIEFNRRATVQVTE
jgi:OOP family OmpA-OmpF porin